MTHTRPLSLLAGIFAVLAAATPARAADLPPDLPLVPADAAGFVRDERKDIALRVIDNQTFLICPPAVAARAAAPPRRDGALAPALDMAAGGSKALVLAVNATALPPQVLAEIPPPLRSLAQVRL